LFVCTDGNEVVFFYFHTFKKKNKNPKSICYVHLSLLEEILSVELACGASVCVDLYIESGVCLFSFLAVQKQI